MSKKDPTTHYMQNRELSWLRFNERVMDEAQDSSVPLLERLRFLTIFTTNLDEFFMVRVGSLIDMLPLGEDSRDNKSFMTAEEQLHAVYQAVRPLYEKRDRLFEDLEKKLRAEGIFKVTFQELDVKDQEYLINFFSNNILPVLQPLIIDAHHPFPHLINKGIEIAVLLGNAKEKEKYAILPVPATLPEIIYIPGNDIRYISTEDLLYELTDIVFDTYDVQEKVIISITRNADINAEDEDIELSGDFRTAMEQMLKERKRLAPLRLEMTNGTSNKIYRFLKEKLKLEDNQIFFSKAPLRMNYAYPLGDKLSESQKKTMLYPEYEPAWPANINPHESMFAQINRHDILLSYPYDSMGPFLKLVDDASKDDNVIAIDITIYRLAKQSQLAQSLIRAAENGKDVTVLIELRARFDEQNNIDWSEELEKAGCTVIYGIPDFKVHSKCCLITCHEKGAIRYYTQIGTGNYNEKTSKIYTDLCFLTADQSIGKDAKAFFRNLGISNLRGQYNKLIVSPVSLKQRVLELISRETKKGSDGYMFFKLSSLTDRDTIDALRNASRAGCRIQMIIRGICCLLPGIPGETENIEVRSVVGRYLEHSRIYIFGTGATEEMYIASADFMTRNTERRVEVGCPIENPEIRAKIHNIIDIMEHDNTKARHMSPEGIYEEIPVPENGVLLNCHDEQMKLSNKNRYHEPDQKERVKERLREQAPQGIRQAARKAANNSEKHGFFYNLFHKNR